MRVSVSSVNIGYYCSYYSYAYRTVFYTVLEYELVPSMDIMHSSYMYSSTRVDTIRLALRIYIRARTMHTPSSTSS